MKITNCVAALATAALLASISAVAGSPTVASFRTDLYIESTASPARFVARGPSYQALVSSQQALVSLPTGENLKMQVIGARGVPGVPERRVPGETHYMLGRDPQAHRQAAHYAAVRFQNVYPNIDVLYRSSDEQLEYDFLVSPGGSVDDIALEFHGGDPKLDSSGALVFRTALGELRHKRPVAYQTVEGKRFKIEAAFRRVPGNGNRYQFDVSEYDPSIALIIDPRIEFSSFVGGRGNDNIRDVSVDADGHVWIVGQTTSPDFPSEDPFFPPTLKGRSDAVVTKLERKKGSDGITNWEVALTLYFGGDGEDLAESVVAGPAGFVYVMGETDSTDFPVTDDGRQRQRGGQHDLFLSVFKITNPDDFFPNNLSKQPPREQGFTPGISLQYSTYHGGSAEERITEGRLSRNVAADSETCAILSGISSSADFPVSVFSLQPNSGGGPDSVTAVYCPDPTRPDAFLSHVYGTYLGGPRPEFRTYSDYADDGSFCIAIETLSQELQGSPGVVQPAFNNEREAFITCQEPIRRRFGLPFLYREISRSFLGGSGNDTLAGYAIESFTAGEQPDFRSLLFLNSDSDDIEAPAGTLFPAGASPVNLGNGSIFVARLNSGLTAMPTGFWYGGSSQDSIESVATNGNCHVLTGRTQSADLFVNFSFPQTQIFGGTDALLVKICIEDGVGIQPVITTHYSGFFGSSAEDFATAAAFTRTAGEIIVGSTNSIDTRAAISKGPERVEQAVRGFAVTTNAVQTGFGGGANDGFVAEFYQPFLERRAIVGAADFRADAIAPGEIITIFGNSFGPDVPITLQLDANGRVATRLGPTRVLFDQVPGSMVFTTANQVSAIAPFGLQGKTFTSIRVESGTSISNAIEVPVAPTSPGIFSQSQAGVGQGAILNQDFSPNSIRRPARGGDVIQIFLTGGGQTRPASVDGELVPLTQPFPELLAQTRVMIGGLEARLLYSGGAPGLVYGVVQVNAFVPASVEPGNAVPVDVTIGTATSQPGITLAVAPR